MLWNSNQNLTQLFQPFIWMESVQERNSAPAARCQGFRKVPETKHGHSDEREHQIWKLRYKPTLFCTEASFHCHSDQGANLVQCKLLHLAAVYNHITHLSSWLLFHLTTSFSLHPLFLNFFSSTFHSPVLFSLWNVVDQAPFCSLE